VGATSTFRFAAVNLNAWVNDQVDVDDHGAADEDL
jgi:hypothetical protein